MINAHLLNPLRSSARALSWIFVAAIGLPFFLNTARAEEPAKLSPAPPPKVTGAETSPAGSPAPTAALSPTPLPKVTKVTGLIALHETLEVDCDGLKEWAKTKTNDKTNDPAKLVLYLDGTVMKGLAPKIDKANTNQLFFKLERLSGIDESKADNSKAWDALFSRPKHIGKKGPLVSQSGRRPVFPLNQMKRHFCTRSIRTGFGLMSPFWLCCSMSFGRPAT